MSTTPREIAHALRERVESQQPATLILAGVVLAFVAFAVKQLTASSSRARRRGVQVRAAGSHKQESTVLLVGPLAAGKTSLFSKVVYGEAPPTHTSMRENEALVKARFDEKDEEALDTTSSLKQPLHLVDLPGHPRLRTRALAHLIPAASGFVFVLDAAGATSAKNVRDAGEHLQILFSLLSLYNSRQASDLAPAKLLILLHRSPSSTTGALAALSSGSPGRLAANGNSEKVNASLVQRARQSLERELERRRSAMLGLGSSGGGSGTGRGAGAKLEGLEEIPVSGGSSPFAALWRLLGLGQHTASSAGRGGGAEGGSAFAGLPTDEGELLSNDDVWPFEGAFDWDKLKDAVEIEWATACSRPLASDSKADVSAFWSWVDSL